MRISNVLDKAYFKGKRYGLMGYLCDIYSYLMRSILGHV
jgi:hypothetical protein